MLTFLPGSQSLALAGLAAASAPVIIHLLNRRRFRVLDWAAMDFLLDASHRSRKLLQLRDLAVLALRVAAVALFGLGVARPFLSTGGRGTSGPVHAIVVIDNSMSMGRERLGGKTLLDDAKARARDLVSRLPTGSRTSIVPLCGPAETFTFDPHRTGDDTDEAVDAIFVVDQTGTAAAALDLAMRAADTAPDLPVKRIVFIGDQQVIMWPADASGMRADSDGETLVAAVRPADTDNTWVEAVRIEDGLADEETPATFTAVVRHEGAGPRSGIEVTLAVDGVDVASETVDLEPGQSREVTFTHRSEGVRATDGPAFAAISVRVSPDSLPTDDVRHVVVPLVSALPIVFVDQFGGGDHSGPASRGETWALRRLVAPMESASDPGRPLGDVRHVRIDDLDRELLADARLVVVAGIRDPGPAVPLLREFVEQGGRLLIAAGGDFDAAAWQSEAWLDGRGLLPAPLTDTVGALPEDATILQPFALAWRTMKDDALFRLPGVSEADLADLYGEPLFFKAIVSAPDAVTAEPGAEPRNDIAQDSPAWLRWAGQAAALPPVVDEKPRVLAAFDNGAAYLVSRRIGRGRTVWVASGLSGPWNTLSRTNAVVLFDRLLRELVAETLPQRTVETGARVTLPLAPEDRRATVRMTRPDGTSESLEVEALGADAYGVTVRNLHQRGLFTVVATKPDLGDVQRRDVTLWTVPLAANGPPRESEPRLLDADAFATKLHGAAGFRWIDPGVPLTADGGRVSGQGTWWWLLLAALGCLVAETMILARSRPEPAGGEAVA